MSHHHSKERLLKWYDFESSSLVRPTSIQFPPSAAFTPTTITTITLQHINPDDRQNVEATIQWSASATVTPPTTPASFELAFFQQATFQIWRDTVGGTLVAQFTDTGLLAATGTTAATTVALSSVTTTITGTDTAAMPGRTHNYILTVTIPGSNASGLITATGFAVETTPVLGTPVVTAFHFAGSVIDENNT